MTLDDLISQLTNVELVTLLTKWKLDDRSLMELEQDVELLVRNIDTQTDPTDAESWSSFRDENIRTIGGMTMNERLWFFNLMDRYEACETEKERRVIYHKVVASP